MKLAVTLALVATTLTVSLPASAQFQKPEDAVKYRQSALSLMGTHFSRLGAMANGRVPFDAKVAQDNAALVETLSKLPWAGFTADSEKLRSKAKPEIWMDQAKFKQASETMMADVAKLNVAAKTGNLDQIKAAFGNAAGSCKACHDAFRE
ncbi:MAG: cytochrome c [Hydrogenophaga sp.]|jgi:cytochrome c556|nr:cytochrome c [Hydrogenophaga sp.]